MNDTIFALSSGAPPAGIAVIRVTGPQAGRAVEMLAGKLPAPRRAFHTMIRSQDGEPLDDGLVLWFPGPASVTGENVAEFHLHGGRAIVAAVQAELAAVAGLRPAEAGEFTRRAFENGRIDLAEAEGLADLLAAETELQRRAAMHLAGGRFSSRVSAWREQVLALSAEVEAALDFDDEDDVSCLSAEFADHLASLAAELRAAALGPAARVLQDGFRIAIAGPPNAGKSTLFNTLVEGEAAITAPVAGTTRDILTRPVSVEGVPLLLVDMAGIRDEGSDAIEVIGIERARQELQKADLTLWLGPEGEGPIGAWEVDARCDLPERSVKHNPRHRISAVSGEGVDALRQDLVREARSAMPGPGENALNDRQATLLSRASAALEDAAALHDPLLVGEGLRMARKDFDSLLGRTSTEDVLDTLFGRFCIGK